MCRRRILQSNLAPSDPRRARRSPRRCCQRRLLLLWTLILFIIGFKAVAKVSMTKAAGTVVILWLSSSAIHVGIRRSSVEGAFVKKFLIAAPGRPGAGRHRLRQPPGRRRGQGGQGLRRAGRRGATWRRSSRRAASCEPRIKVNISAHVVGKIDKLYVRGGRLDREGQALPRAWSSRPSSPSATSGRRSSAARRPRCGRPRSRSPTRATSSTAPSGCKAEGDHHPRAARGRAARRDLRPPPARRRPRSGPSRRRPTWSRPRTTSPRPPSTRR